MQTVCSLYFFGLHMWNLLLFILDIVHLLIQLYLSFVDGFFPCQIWPPIVHKTSKYCFDCVFSHSSGNVLLIKCGKESIGSNATLHKVYLVLRCRFSIVRMLIGQTHCPNSDSGYINQRQQQPGASTFLREVADRLGPASSRQQLFLCQSLCKYTTNKFFKKTESHVAFTYSTVQRVN